MAEIVVDLQEFKPDRTYEECLEMCEKLGLVEIVIHGDHDYGRMTQDGVNVFRTLLRLVHNMADDNNVLRSS